MVSKSGNRDGIPVALMEAMAMQSPPISTPISGIPELIDDGTNGLLVEPTRIEALARAITTLLSNDSKRSRLGNNARSTVEQRFNIANEVGKLEHVFDNVITDRE